MILNQYISQFQLREKAFQYILLKSIPCLIHDKFQIKNLDKKQIEEYKGSIIKNISIHKSPILSYDFIREKDKELEIHLPSIIIELCLIDRYIAKDRGLLFDKVSELNIERLIHYEFKEDFWTVPLKSETLDLFVEKITFAIYDYMEDLVRDILNGEVFSIEGFGLQLEESQVEHVFDENLLVLEP